MRKILVAMLMALPGAVAAETPEEGGAYPVPKWIASVRVDAFTDKKEARASIQSVDGGKALVVACNGIVEPTLSLQFLAGRYLGSRGNVVQVRIGETPMLPETVWEFASKGAYTTNAAFIDLFTSRAGSHETRILIRVFDYENQPVTGSFYAGGALAAINQVREACGLDKIEEG